MEDLATGDFGVATSADVQRPCRGHVDPAAVTHVNARFHGVFPFNSRTMARRGRSRTRFASRMSVSRATWLFHHATNAVTTVGPTAEQK